MKVMLALHSVCSRPSPSLHRKFSSGMRERALGIYVEVITLAHVRSASLVVSSGARILHSVISAAISLKTRPCRQDSPLKACAFQAFQRATAQAAKKTCHSLPCRALGCSELKKSWTAVEEIARSFSPTLVHTASASLHRSKMWFIVYAAGHRSHPLCITTFAQCFLSMLSLVFCLSLNASHRNTRCLFGMILSHIYGAKGQVLPLKLSSL